MIILRNNSVIEKLWETESNKKSFSPKEFMNKVNKIDSNFNICQAGDPKDFIYFVLRRLHEELKTSVNLNCLNNVKAEMNCLTFF